MSEVVRMTEVMINGTKFEIDLSTARKIDQYRIGDSVKVLDKNYNGYQIKNGVITEFVNFKELPTIVVATFKTQYGALPTIEFVYFNVNTKDMELAPATDHENRLDKNAVVKQFEIEIQTRKREIEELEAKKNWFIENFQKWFDRPTRKELVSGVSGDDEY